MNLMNMRSVVTSFGGLLVLGGVPLFVRAEGFVPIVPLPFEVSVEAGISAYLNGLFSISISMAAALAVIMIVVGGFEYMTSEAMGGKSKGRERIQGAVIGLVLLLASWLILYVINPCILELNIFGTVGSGATTGCTTPTNSGAVPRAVTPAGGGKDLTDPRPPTVERRL